MAIPNRYRKIINKSAEDYLETYDEKMIEELLQILNDELEGAEPVSVSPEHIEELVQNWQFLLPDPGQWAGEKAYCEYEDAMEAKADEERDERMMNEDE